MNKLGDFDLDPDDDLVLFYVISVDRMKFFIATRNHNMIRMNWF